MKIRNIKGKSAKVYLLFNADELYHESLTRAAKSFFSVLHLTYIFIKVSFSASHAQPRYYMPVLLQELLQNKCVTVCLTLCIF